MPSPEEQVAALDARAQRFETPCGEGSVVWRRWGSGPPVVLGHGAQGAWSHWIRNIDALAAEHTVWAVDQPGSGESAMLDGSDHRALSAALAQGLRRLPGIDAPVDLVGFSFSGTAFAHLAAYYPELVRRVILVGTGGLDTPHGHVDLRKVKGLQGDERIEGLTRNLLGLMIHHRASVDDLARYLLVKNARACRWAPPELVIPDMLVNILPEIKAQVDAIWGEFDRPHPDPEVQADVLRRFDPDVDFRTIADAGHWVMYERAEAFNEALLDMLRLPLRERA
jgi:pimeloyl-ACP methyl ester carboxylesterase